MTRIFRPMAALSCLPASGHSSPAANTHLPRFHAEYLLILLTAFSLVAVCVFKRLTVQNYGALDRRFQSLSERCIALNYTGVGTSVE